MVQNREPCWYVKIFYHCSKYITLYSFYYVNQFLLYKPVFKFFFLSFHWSHFSHCCEFSIHLAYITIMKEMILSYPLNIILIYIHFCQHFNQARTRRTRPSWSISCGNGNQFRTTGPRHAGEVEHCYTWSSDQVTRSDNKESALTADQGTVSWSSDFSFQGN